MGICLLQLTEQLQSPLQISYKLHVQSYFTKKQQYQQSSYIPVLRDVVNVGLCLELRLKLAMEELSGNSSTAGVGTTLCRSCLGDEDATLRVLRAPSRTAPAVVCVGTSMPLFLGSHGRTFSDSVISLCTAYWESVPDKNSGKEITIF